MRWAKYGEAKQDFWKIAVADCKDCIVRKAPEPASILLLLCALCALAASRSPVLRRANQSRAKG